MTDDTQARHALVRYLSRREHSEYELKNKLMAKGFSSESIDLALAFAKKHDLQSDWRFACAKVKDLAARGYGEQRAKSELQSHHIDNELALSAMYEQDLDWFQIAREIYIKKYTMPNIQEPTVKNKVMRKMVQRGFTYEQVLCAIE